LSAFLRFPSEGKVDERARTQVTFRGLAAPTERPEKEEAMGDGFRRRARPSLQVSLATALIGLLCSAYAAAQGHAVAVPLTTSSAQPKEFGVQDTTRTIISATAFLPDQFDDVIEYGTDPDNLGRYCIGCDQLTGDFYSTLDIPAGAVIDFIGLNNATDTDHVIGFALWQRDRSGNKTPLLIYDCPAHGWDTDFAGPLGIPVPNHVDKELVLQVEQAVSPNYQYFAWMEVWWHRSVSPPPATASFSDVPTSHPYFQFIEALRASGVTGGCGDGSTYCPDSPLTRGQMAVFLAKALGLHWPN
jgi:S-layer homology domain